jgi:hypothetical protein
MSAMPAVIGAGFSALTSRERTLILAGPQPAEPLPTQTQTTNGPFLRTPCTRVIPPVRFRVRTAADQQGPCHSGLAPKEPDTLLLPAWAPDRILYRILHRKGGSVDSQHAGSPPVLAAGTRFLLIDKAANHV